MDWSKAIQIDRSWPTRILNHHFDKIDGKVSVCVYSVKSTGTQVLADNIVDILHDIIPEFALGKQRIDEINSPMKIAFMASSFFGDTDPIRDGKYGELLLFALVEAILGCKMVAHKIRALTNANDQVKGGDGIFLGDYKVAESRIEPAYFIGESKVVSDFNDGLPSAFSSIYRFHDPVTSLLTKNTEFLIATDNLVLNDQIDIEELYKRLTPGSDEFENQILVHPVLIMYNSKMITECEKKALSKNELEELIANEVQKRQEGFIKSINTQLKKYDKINAVHLHFFMIPFSDVDAFRNSMYAKIHNGITYRSKKP